MAQFMFIFRHPSASPGSAEQLQQHMQKWITWFDGLRRDGIYQGVGAPLEEVGRVVRGVREAVSDGPYAESKDLVGGAAIIEARDLDAAVEIARGCPTYERSGTVEVRPVRPAAA
jgi:hypothetical protein